MHILFFYCDILLDQLIKMATDKIYTKFREFCKNSISLVAIKIVIH